MRDLEDSSPLSPTAGSKRWRLTRLLSGGRWPQATHFIVVLLILYAVKQVFSVAAYYPVSGHDELAHFSYVRTLASDGRLPPPSVGRIHSPGGSVPYVDSKL